MATISEIMIGNPMDEDEDGHGTHCAGVISAVSDNNKGICGISNAKLMALKVSILPAHHTIPLSSRLLITSIKRRLLAQILPPSTVPGVAVEVVQPLWKRWLTRLGKMAVCFFLLPETMAENHDNAISDGCPYDLDSPYVVTVGASTQTDKKASFSDYGNKTGSTFLHRAGIFFPQ